MSKLQEIPSMKGPQPLEGSGLAVEEAWLHKLNESVLMATGCLVGMALSCASEVKVAGAVGGKEIERQISEKVADRVLVINKRMGQWEALAHGVSNLVGTVPDATLFAAVATAAARSCGGDRGQLFLVDEERGRLWSRSLDGSREVSTDFAHSIPGQVVSERRLINTTRGATHGPTERAPGSPNHPPLSPMRRGGGGGGEGDENSGPNSTAANANEQEGGGNGGGQWSWSALPSHVPGGPPHTHPTSPKYIQGVTAPMGGSRVCVLAAPVFGQDGRVLGAIEVVREDPTGFAGFEREEEDLVTRLCAVVGNTLVHLNSTTAERAELKGLRQLLSEVRAQPNTPYPHPNIPTHPTVHEPRTTNQPPRANRHEPNSTYGPRLSPR